MLHASFYPELPRECQTIPLTKLTSDNYSFTVVQMIMHIRHRVLRRFYETGDAKGLAADKLARIRRILSALDAAHSPEEVNILPGMKLHPLKGDLSGFYAVSVSGNWRIVFRFEKTDVYDVDLLDYH